MQFSDLNGNAKENIFFYTFPESQDPTSKMLSGLGRAMQP
jgi:hypothetical protein